MIGLIAFSSFFPQKVRFCLPNLANLLVAQPRVCINILLVSTLQNVDFAHYRSHCKICPLTSMTILRFCTVGNCWQRANFTMGPNGQNQHFAELRQNVCLYIHALVLLGGLLSLEGKNEFFCGKKEEKAISTIKSDIL